MRGASLLLLGLLAGAAVAQDCTYQTSARDPYTGNMVYYNFSQLSKIVPLNPDQDFTATDSLIPDWEYHFRICELAKHSCGGSAVPITPACQVSAADPENQDLTVVLGSLDSMSFHDMPSSDKGSGVVLEYADGAICVGSGDLHKVTIYLECDPQIVGPLTVLAASHHATTNCSTEIYGKSAYACPDEGAFICDSAATCEECASVEGCGWCAALQHCMPGDQESPNADTYCYGSHNWIYGSTDSCVACSGVTSGSACAAEPDCHWCVSGSNLGCQPRLNACEVEIYTCDTPCNKGTYCPSEGGKCAKVPSAAGMFIGGMILSAGLVGIGYAAVYYYKKRRGANYEGLS